MCVSVLFCSPQVLVMITSTLYTRRTTAICLVPTTSRSFPIGPHISQHWCHSCALTAYPAALCVYHILEKKHPPPAPGFLANLLLISSCCLSAQLTAETQKQERGSRQRILLCQSKEQAVILSAEHAEVKILFQAKLYLCHHHLGSLWFSASNSLKWHQAHTTADRVNRSNFASLQDQLLLYGVFEFYWMFSQHTVNEVQDKWLSQFADLCLFVWSSRLMLCYRTQ